MFEAAPVRGELVRLADTWQEIMRRTNYPPAVQRLLGEMTAAAALLTANLKFDGALIMQLHGDGPVRMLVVECNSDLSMRATAKWAEDVEIADDATLSELVNVSGQGRFAMTLDPHNKLPGQQPYQGIVPLSGRHGQLADMSAVLEHYMLSSEQLDTRLWLAADEKTAAGMLLQRLPTYGGKSATGEIVGETGQPLTPGVAAQDLDTWERVCHIGATLQHEELLDVQPQTLLRRLFWEETEHAGVRVFEPRIPRFSCSCSRLKVGSMLRMLGKDEVASVLAERNQVDVNCEFCGEHYAFDAVDCAHLFTEQPIAQTVKGISSSQH
jgi:molecular chaperone Hsp33